MPSTRRSRPVSDAPYLAPTPRGCYGAVCANDVPLTRRVVLALLAFASSPTVDALVAALAQTDRVDPRGLVRRMVEAGLLARTDTPLHCPEGSLEVLLPPLIDGLSADGRGLLADACGLPIGVQGFDVDTAGRLAALSAVVLEAGERHHAVFRDRFGIHTQAWGLLDAGGRARLGIWPVRLAGQRAALVLQGRPRLDQPAFATLSWLLARRYGGH